MVLLGIIRLLQRSCKSLYLAVFIAIFILYAGLGATPSSISSFWLVEQFDEVLDDVFLGLLKLSEGSLLTLIPKVHFEEKRVCFTFLEL